MAACVHMSLVWMLLPKLCLAIAVSSDPSGLSLASKSIANRIAPSLLFTFSAKSCLPIVCAWYSHEQTYTQQNKCMFYEAVGESVATTAPGGPWAGSRSGYVSTQILLSHQNHTYENVSANIFTWVSESILCLLMFASCTLPQFLGQYPGPISKPPSRNARSRPTTVLWMGHRSPAQACTKRSIFV